MKDVTFDLARQAREFTVLDLIPFQKICNACESKLISLIEVEKKRKEMSYINESSTEDTEEEVYGTPPEEEISRIDNQHKVDHYFNFFILQNPSVDSSSNLLFSRATFCRNFS